MKKEIVGKREVNILIEFLHLGTGKIVRDEPFPPPNEARRFARHADKVRRRLKKTRNPHRGRK